ncbi:MAG: hypothetical protein GC154_01055 [bacterium]|nr:hypothetical protein [bacterium]
MNPENKTLVFRTNHLHQYGEIRPARLRCTPGIPLEILDAAGAADIVLPAAMHVTLARVDTHVHFRESYIPRREEFESDLYRPADQSYEALVDTARAANAKYGFEQGSLAALKGGVWLIGAMGNTAWAPLGEERWRRIDEYYQQRALIATHVWPRMEPGVAPIAGQEEKDFGSTFGGSGISGGQRRQMYLDRRGGMVSYHNDRAREDESIHDFQRRIQPPDYLLHHLYYDGETVLAAQRETFTYAREAELKRLLTRHIPTGAALDMILSARLDSPVELPAEVGLDYLYFNRDMLAERATREINYRRPALPSKEDQTSLIALTKECARRRDPLTFIGSDHAPHPLAAKRLRPDGMPGSPGTRVLELSHQVHMHLLHQHGFTHHDLDWLTAIAPARYVAQYKSFPFPAGEMETGAMANLVIFDPDEPFSVKEDTLREELRDVEYHSAYRDEKLRGRVYYTVVNGLVFDVAGPVRPLNGAGSPIKKLELD